MTSQSRNVIMAVLKNYQEINRQKADDLIADVVRQSRPMPVGGQLEVRLSLDDVIARAMEEIVVAQ